MCIMKKKVLGAVLVTLLVVSQALGVCAAGSKEAGITITTPGVVFETGDDAFKDVPADTKADIDALNNGGSFSDFAKDEVGASKELSGYVAATKVVDVVATADAKKESDGLYHVSFSGVALKDGMTVKNVYGLHYVNGAWELMRPLSVDTKNNTVIFGFKSFSPFVIATKDVQTSGKKHHSSSKSAEEETTTVAAATTADAAAQADAASATATSPKTGVESTWGLWMAAGLVLAGMAGMTAKKRS